MTAITDITPTKNYKLLPKGGDADGELLERAKAHQAKGPTS